MFVALWEFEVKSGCEQSFERVYGADGDWVRLFRGDANYQGTRLLRDPACDRIYVTLDFWRSREWYDRFRAAARESYAAIGAACEGLTASATSARLNTTSRRKHRSPLTSSSAPMHLGPKLDQPVRRKIWLKKTTRLSRFAQ